VYIMFMYCLGPSRGVCKCGKCHCKLGYTGKSCNCPTSKESCMAKNGVGVGLCVSRCVCVCVCVYMCVCDY